MLMIKYQQKSIQKSFQVSQKNSFSSPDFVDGDHLNALTGGDGHQDVIKVNDHDDNLSTELWSIFWFGMW